MNRIVKAARLQLVAWPSALAWPWGILALSFVVNVAIFSALRNQGVNNDDGFTGGLLSIYVVMLVAYLQAMTKEFSFAFSLGMSRRSYYLGVTLFAVVQSVLYGVIIYLFRLVEDATNGWGLDLQFFGIPFLRQANPVLQLLVYIVPFLLAAALGMAYGVLLRRWGTNGVMTLAACSIVVGGLAIVLATLQDWWPSIGQWFVDQSAFSLFAAWPSLLALVVGAAGYLVARRITPA